MSDQENKLLKKIADIEKLLLSKEQEMTSYRSQLFQLSHQLDEMIASDETELNALRQLFQHMVPTEMPQINGFEFSRKFVYGTQTGGDYFDLFLNKDKFKWSLLLSSASNYSTSAIILAQIFNNSALFSNNTTSVHDKVKKLLSDVAATPSASQFSLFFGQVDRRDLGFELYCQGQICGVVNNSAMTQIISAESPGENGSLAPSIRTITLNLEPKTKVCLVTPGVLEVLSIQKIASICQSMASLDVHSLRNEIFLQAELQSGRQQPLRDQIVFVFEIKENIIKIAR